MPRIRFVHYTSDFRNAYKKLSPTMKGMVDRKDKLFREDPFSPALRAHKLSGGLSGLWSFRVTFSHRVLFEFIKNGAIFYDVGTHDIYK